MDIRDIYGHFSNIISCENMNSLQIESYPLPTPEEHFPPFSPLPVPSMIKYLITYY